MAGDIILSNGTTITAAELAEIAGEVKKLIAKEAKEPSQYEEVNSLANLTTLPALLQNGLEFKLVRVAVQLLNPVLQKTDLAIQWKRGDTGQFVDLITIAEIQAPAKAATDAANAAATKANTAATNADTATGKANTATTNANAAATSANNAAASANAAATAANNAADRVDASITDISGRKPLLSMRPTVPTKRLLPPTVRLRRRLRRLLRRIMRHRRPRMRLRLR